MNRLKDKWLWVQRRDGTREKIAPIDITTSYDSNPIIHPSSFRADFDLGAIRFIVGVHQTYLAPESKEEWRHNFHNPPSREEILSKIGSKNISLFAIDGPGPRFMQDLNVGELVKNESIATLLPETPGASTVKSNKDFFVREGTVKALCPDCASMALYMQQINGAMSGRASRTSIGSGISGPLNILILRDTLYKTVMSNVMLKKDVFDMGGNPKGPLLPWTIPSVKSDKGDCVKQADVHPFYYHWEMSRRYHLNFNGTEGTCDVCGEKGQVITTIKKGLSGNFYKSDFNHTLYPSYIIQKKGKKKGKEDIKKYRDPLFLLSFINLIQYMVPYKNSNPAQIFKSDFLDDTGSTPKIWVTGYAFARAAYLGWVNHVRDIPFIIRENSDQAVELMKVAQKIAGVLILHINFMKMSLQERKKKRRISKSPAKIKYTDILLNKFYTAIEPDFYEALKNKDINQWLRNTVIKMFEIFRDEMQDYKIGLQYYFVKPMIEKINSNAELIEAQKLNFKDFLPPHVYKNLDLLHFQRELRHNIMSWYGTIKATNKRLQFSKALTIKDIKSSPDFDDLTLIISDHYEDIENKHDILAAWLLIIFKIKKVDFHNSFPAQIALNSVLERHLNNLLKYEDVASNWKLFHNITGQLERVNILSLLEGMMQWDDDLKKYWKREFMYYK